MTKFKINKKYECVSVCDSECVFTIEVIKRTDKFITFKYQDSILTKKVYILSEHNQDVEYIHILGKYSMSPMMFADKEIEEEKEIIKEEITDYQEDTNSGFLNLSIVEGSLSRDPELYYTTNGKSICKFDILVKFSLKTDNKTIENTTLIHVNTWNKIADACSKYLKKGFKVRVRGALKQDTWYQKNEKRTKIYIEAGSVEFLK